MKIICKKCRSNKIKKNGKRQGRQRYLCKLCGYVWEHGYHKNIQSIDFNELFREYVRDDLKYRQMCLTYNVSKKTIQRGLENVNFKKIIATFYYPKQ